MKKLAVLISNAGTGTNLQAIIDAIKSRKLDAEIAVVISDAPDAFGLKRARDNGIPTLVYKETLKRKNVHGVSELGRILKSYGVDLVCLAGWKQIISDSLISNLKILNVHPGLIPDTIDGVVKNPDGTDALWNKGKFTEKAAQNFLDQKATFAGSTVHLLTSDVDFGEVLKRGFVKVEPGDTVETLYSRLKKEENRIYVDALRELCNG